ncbi:hypothetical protein, partial [Cyclobacterium roseum]|uniref:hypothetical protein n=1 Tax=Cyclobacterium roseum TaxID=2666137 RepID=UPI001F15FA12
VSQTAVSVLTNRNHILRPRGRMRWHYLSRPSGSHRSPNLPKGWKRRTGRPACGRQVWQRTKRELWAGAEGRHKDIHLTERTEPKKNIQWIFLAKGQLQGGLK